MRRTSAIGLGLCLAARAIVGAPPEAKAEDRFEILQSLDRYQEVTTRCYLSGQEYDVDFVFDTLLDTNKISQAMEMAVIRLAWQIDPRPSFQIQAVGESGKTDPKFTDCFLQGKEVRRAKVPAGGRQSPDRPTIVIAVLATNLDVDNGSEFAGQMEIQSEVSDGWPTVTLEQNGAWRNRRGFQDYISMVSSVGPARLIQCLQNKPPTFENVPSKFLVGSVIMRCAANKETKPAALMIFGLGNFVGWGQFDQTQKLDIEDAGYFALEFEAFRSLGELVGE